MGERPASHALQAAIRNAKPVAAFMEGEDVAIWLTGSKDAVAKLYREIDDLTLRCEHVTKYDHPRGTLLKIWTKGEYNPECPEGIKERLHSELNKAGVKITETDGIIKEMKRSENPDMLYQSCIQPLQQRHIG